jgi:hypothetical protein
VYNRPEVDSCQLPVPEISKLSRGACRNLSAETGVNFARSARDCSGMDTLLDLLHARNLKMRVITLSLA